MPVARSKVNKRRLLFMKIRFLAVNCSYSHSSLAAWCLGAVMPPVGWDWKTIEVTVKDAPEAVLARVVEDSPHVVAATLYLFNRDFVMGILAGVRKRFPECLILVGGPECLGDNRELVGPQGVADAAIRGEGERAFPDLLARWARGDDWSTFPGVCRGDGSGGYHDGGIAEGLAELDDIPPFYARELAGFSKPFVQLETSRGCGNGCLFCTSRLTSPRFHSLDRVRSDLNDIQRAGIKEVRIIDRTYNEDTGRAMRLTALFRDEFSCIRFHLEIDPARFGEGLAREFAKAAPGRFHLEAGVQSLNPEVYAAIGRKATVTRTLEGLQRLCGLRNLEVHVDLIAGLPGGTLPGLLNDLQTILPLSPAEIQLERLKLLPGTPLALNPEKWGLSGSPTPPYQVTSTAGMDREDLARADRLSRLLDWYYNQDSLGDLIAAAVKLLPDFLDGFERWAGKQAGFTVCPNLEDRFRVLDGYLQGLEAGPYSGLIQHLHYRWYRLGFSTRQGPCPAIPWKARIPETAELIEGDASARVSRTVRVELDTPHFFCYGTGVDGGRAVVAVYRNQRA